MAKLIGLIKQTNPQILTVLETDSEVLARIQADFHTMIRARGNRGCQPIHITCFFEELPLPGIGEVRTTVLRCYRFCDATHVPALELFLQNAQNLSALITILFPPLGSSVPTMSLTHLNIR